MQNYLSALNPAQKEAVINTKGPSLVIAGAGSGKTRVLTYRIVHLLENGAKPYKILSLTFTNKAAKEMKERIAQIIGADKAKSLWMGTFHSIFAKILRAEAEKLGYPSNFTIYDSVDTKSILRSIIKELQLDSETYKPSGVYARISKAKNNLVTASAYESNTTLRNNDIHSKRPELYRIYNIYSKKCKDAGAMDFDDLLLNTNILFRNNPEVLDKYQKRFNFILVDEYQDTNFSQYLIVKKLAEQHRNICVVGDDAQSIYSFRGAKIENILNFKKDYKDYKIFKLEQNYRSTKNIVNAANSIIEKNTNQIQKDVFSKNEDGNKIELIEALTDNEEGYLIVNKIFDSVYTEHTEYKDHSILYRTNAQSRIMEEALRRRNIPYKIYGGTSFYQRKEIKDLLAYCKFTVNSKDNESLKRIINYPKRGIGQTTIDRIETYANENALSMWEVIKKTRKIDIKLNSRALNQIYGFASKIEDFRAKLDTTNAYELAKEIATTSGIMKELFKDKAPEGVARHENVQELLNGIKEFSESGDTEENVTLPVFLETVALLTNEDNESDEDRNKVTLMTIHSSKGLEFMNVYIVGVEEGLFPSEMSAFSPKDLEEERRLFYVAVTRAEKKLTISYARQRYRWGQLKDCVSSRFITDINPKFIDTTQTQINDGTDFDVNENLKQDNKKYNFTKKKSFSGTMKKKDNKKSFDSTPKNKNLKKVNFNAKSEKVPDDVEKITVGMQVKHTRFGFGKVVEIEGKYPNAKATIDFHNSGTKQLLLKYANLLIIK